MEHIEIIFSNKDHMIRNISIIMVLLPPPVSLNLLCAVTNLSPVEVLQTVEFLIQLGYLIPDKKKGAGHYCLSDFKTIRSKLFQLPESVLMNAAKNAVTGVCNHLPDNNRRWLNLAHIYQISGLPLVHHKEVVKAGHYCLELNLPMDAALYYRIALESMAKSTLDHKSQKDFIDAAIGLCICKDNSLSPDIQRKFLTLALDFSERHKDPVSSVKIRILIAKTYTKTKKNDEATKHLEIVWQMLSEYDFPEDIQLQVILTNSELLFWQGYITKAIDRYESVIGSQEKLPSDAETLKSCIRLAVTYGVAGEPARGIGLIRAVRKKAKELEALSLDRFAALAHVMILSDAGRINEGEPLLKEFFKTPEEVLDRYLLWPGNGKKSFFEYSRGRYEDAFIYLDRAWKYSKAIKTPHHRGPDNLSIMLGLEQMGMVHPEWQFDSEINRLLEWPDIYMKGVAYRFRALKAFKGEGDISQIKADLRKSIKLLTKSGAKIELSHACVLLARVLIREKNTTETKKLLKSAWEVFSKVNPDLFPKDLKPYLDQTSKNALWVESLLKVSEALNASKTKEELLGKIIRQAMMITGAERGAIFLRQDHQLVMVANRNIQSADISLKMFSAQIKLIEDVFDTGTPITRTPENCTFEKNGLDSAMGWTGCFPIRLKSSVMGVIFIDQPTTRLQLSEEEAGLLRIICNQAAVALENIEVYEEIIDQKSELEAETYFYRQSFESNPFKNLLIGHSKPFRKMLNRMSRVAETDTTVMITGETGVGKDMVAQAIHQHSKRSSEPFIAVNVLSLSPELVASELFGHEKGAFTGAAQTRKGRFELASRGTLFLDDIDAFPLDIQVKLLRVLETKAFERVGGTRTIKTRFRLLAASNRELEYLVEQGLFRSDFYYRLNVFPIKVPALRDRVEDIPLLVEHFMNMFAKKSGQQFNKISKRDLEHLMDYRWPGNIRELRHVIERAILLSKNRDLVIPPLDSFSPKSFSCEEKILSYTEMEISHIRKALARCHGKVSGKGSAAELLELKPATLYSKMKRLGIEKEVYQFKIKKNKGVKLDMA